MFHNHKLGAAESLPACTIENFYVLFYMFLIILTIIKENLDLAIQKTKLSFLTALFC